MIGETTVHASPAIDDEQPKGPPADADPGAPADSTVVPEPAGDTRPEEFGGRPGPDPTRYGDWEKNGRCIDF